MITDLFDVASSTASLTSFAQDGSTLIALAVGAILVILAALLGLGYGVRHFTRWITGRKF